MRSSTCFFAGAEDFLLFFLLDILDCDDEFDEPVLQYTSTQIIINRTTITPIVILSMIFGSSKYKIKI
jgi:hypothetical protein